MAHQQAQPRKTYAAVSSLEVFHTGGPVRLSPDGLFVATACVEAVSVVEVATGKVLHTLEGDTEPITALAWSKDSRRVFTASRSMRCAVWDATTGERVRTFKAHATPVLYMAVDPTGALLVTASADRTARVWDVAKGFCTHAFRGHAAMVTHAAFHPDPRRLELYTGSHDGEIRVWSLRDRACVGVMHEHTSGITGLTVPMAAAGGSDVLLSSARDRVVHQWSLKTKKRVATVPTHEACEGLVALDPRAARGLLGADAADENPDAVYFATAGEKGVVRAWRVGNAKPVAKSASLRAGQSSAAAHTGQADEEHDDAAAGTFTSLHATPTGDGLLAVTGDARLLFYGDDNVETDAPAGGGSIVVKRELIGNTDEIISAAFLTTDLGGGSLGGGGGGGAGRGAPGR
jgi:U3 small nucleolar RNA-associated protein 13